MGRNMKEFTYFGDHELDNDPSRWLSKMGLEETLWILDIKWITSVQTSFNEWIGEE